eukprot:GFUD01022240.1.p1 GENE.GFUD01022240.1~~GFUD01022240.1.p1  ORF type:complete len:511 (+),score=143.09 GFUD01022240.1:49-1581(+)
MENVYESSEFSESSDERADGEVFDDVNGTSSPVIPVSSSRRPISRGRVHNYSTQALVGEKEFTWKVEVDENSNSVEQGQVRIDKAHRLVSAKPVQRTLSDHVSKIRLESPSCVSEKAKLSSSPLSRESSPLKTCLNSPEEVKIQKAQLASDNNCPNKLFILPIEEEPLDCCSPAVPTLPRTVPLLPLPVYTIEREQLFPGSVFDSHCHLDFVYRRLRGMADCSPVQSLQDCLDLDREELGDSFGGCVANFCNPTDWGQGRSGRLVSKEIKDSVKDSRVFITIGCHPHYADRMNGNRMDQLSMLVSGLSRNMVAKVVALGECGLDYSKKNMVDKEVQKQVFADQLKIALKFRLPLVLHIRNAEADGYTVLQSAGVPPSWPIHRHCFAGDWDTAATWLDKYPGSKIGVTGLVTYQEAVRVHQVVRNIPLNRLLLETDAPYFLPARTDKGRYPWNCALPGHVLHVAAQVAAIKGVELRDVLEQNLNNVKEIYRVGGGGKVGMKKVEIVRAKLD